MLRHTQENIRNTDLRFSCMSKHFRQFSKRFSTYDWKISTEHGSVVPAGVPVGNCVSETVNNIEIKPSRGRSFLFFIVSHLLPLHGLVKKSMKHDLKFLEISKSRKILGRDSA